MKKTLFIIALLASICANAQFDNVKIRYENDSTFSIKTDSNMRSYCDVEPVNYLGNTISRIRINSYTNYGNQPYELLPIRDSNGVQLPAVLGITNTATANFTFVGSDGNIEKTISITDINSNYYTTLYLYRDKFLYWLIAEKMNVTIK